MDLPNNWAFFSRAGGCFAVRTFAAKTTFCHFMITRTYDTPPCPDPEDSGAAEMFPAVLYKLILVVNFG
jgi:hypothetical protein